MDKKYTVNRLVDWEDSIGFLSSIKDTDGMIVEMDDVSSSARLTALLVELGRINERREQIIDIFKSRVAQR